MEFNNKYYKSNWTQHTDTGHPYALGTANETDNGWAVYDGATNYMGKISPDGGAVCNGAETEYKHSFLRAAREALGL